MIEIYTKDNCMYCVSAKNALSDLGVPYTVYNLGENFSREELLEKFPFAKTYPVVVINGKYIGGYVELEQQIMEQSTNLGKTFLVE